MDYLHAYIINGDTVGTDVGNWSKDDLNDNPAFIVSANAVEAGYTNITYIESWENFGPSLLYRHNKIRNLINAEWGVMTSPGYDWDNLNAAEKKIIASKFLVDKTKRDEVLTQAEQDDLDHYILYHHLSDDVIERLGRVNYLTTPKSIDYKKDLDIRLHPEYVFDDRGFLTTVIYYEDLSVTLNQFGFPVYNFSGPVVKYEASYNVDEDTGYVTTRVITRSWMRMCGDWGTDPKVALKIYNSKQAREEGTRRRKNLITNILIDTVGLLLMTTPELTTVSDTEAEAMPFLQDVQSEISLYYESGAKKDSNGNDCLLIQAVSVNTYNRLDNVISASPYMTIRDYIILKLDPQV